MNQLKNKYIKMMPKITTHVFQIRFRVSWDLGIIMPLLVYLTIMMPFRLCFANEAQSDEPIFWWEFIIDILFLLDIPLNFRTGYFVLSAGERVSGLDSVDTSGLGDGNTDALEELVEYDKWRVGVNYAKV